MSSTVCCRSGSGSATDAPRCWCCLNLSLLLLLVDVTLIGLDKKDSAEALLLVDVINELVLAVSIILERKLNRMMFVWMILTL